jgi:hypothetical protein
MDRGEDTMRRHLRRGNFSMRETSENTVPPLRKPPTRSCIHHERYTEDIRKCTHATVQLEQRHLSAIEIRAELARLQGIMLGRTMRPLQSGAIVISFIAALASYSVSQQNVADVVKQSSDAVVLIVISNSAGQETALGSGFLVSPDGEIVTNYHVINEGHSAVVKLSNGAFFSVAGVLASEADKDLAVIKVNGKICRICRLATLKSCTSEITLLLSAAH